MPLKIYTLRLLACFFLGLLLLESERFDGVINPFCLHLAQFIFALIHWLDHSTTLTDAVLRHGVSGFALEVGKPCSALPQAWLLMSGLWAFQTRLLSRLKNIVLGFLAVQLLNVTRLILVFYVGNGVSPATLTFIHEQVFQWLFSVLLLLLFFVLSKQLSFSSQQAAETG
jgi:exosortase/archaeosortase family protein